jgi:ATP-dependent DNA helicase RecG
LNVTVYSKTFEGGDSDKVIGRVGDRVGDKVGDRVGDKLSETQKRILNLMQQNPSVSAQSLSEEIGISKRKIEENIRTLRERSKIVRIGNAKSGHWEVLD